MRVVVDEFWPQKGPLVLGDGIRHRALAELTVERDG
jgi:hypothetical protein